MERILEVPAAYDKRSDDPKKDYGIHSAEIRMILKGPEGAVQFVVYTARYDEAVHKELIRKQHIPKEYEPLHKWFGPMTPGKEVEELIEYGRWFRKSFPGHSMMGFLFKPQPADVGYHSPKPMHAHQDPTGSWQYTGEMIMEVVSDSPSQATLIEVPERVRKEPPPCPYLDGKPCYYDGSGLHAERVYDLLLNQGEEAVWKYLEKYYQDTFECV